MSDPTSKPILRAQVADARAWAGWIRALRAEIADQKDAGELNPDLAAPEHVYQTLLELLAAIDELPRDAEQADLALPQRQRLAELVDQQRLVHSLVDRWVALGLLAARPPPEVERFEQQLVRCAQRPDDRA